MKKNRLTLRTTFALTSLAFCAFTAAQTAISRDGRVERLGPPKVGLNPQDAAFIKDAAAGNTFEVRSSQLALKNGKSAFLKKFAKRMILDHGSSFEELKLIAKKKGKIVPKSLPPKLQRVIAKLTHLSGSAFDSAYVMAQKEAHAETTAVLKREIQNGRDGDVKGYAISTLPAVKMHVKMLEMKM